MQSASELARSAARTVRRQAPWIALLLGAGSHAAWGGDLYVICNPGVSLQGSEVRNVFLGEKGFAGSVRLAPADNEAAQPEFLEKVLRLDAGKYSAQWTKRSFLNGISPPPAEGTDAEAIAYVRKTIGGCSYVTSQPGSGVTVVARFP